MPRGLVMSSSPTPVRAPGADVAQRWATTPISTHWLRHTTLTWVERNFGYAIARAYAGHTDHDNAGSTATYVRANLPEVASALAVLTGEPHPLAN